MALATKCPHCQTTFRVAHDQLKLRAGLVRCGACKEIFNGIEHLLRPEDHGSAPFQKRSPTESAVPAPAPAANHAVPDMQEPPAPPQNIDVAVVPAPPDAGSLDIPSSGLAPSAAEPSAQESVVPPPSAVEEYFPSPGIAASNSADFDNASSDRYTDQAEYVEPQPVVDAEASIASAALASSLDFDVPSTDDDAMAEPISAPAHAPAPVNADLASNDPLQRMTLIDFTSPDDVVEDPSHIKVAPVDPNAVDELEVAIADLQRKPWRDESKPLTDIDDPEASVTDVPNFVKRGERQQRLGRTMRLLMIGGSLLLLVALLFQGAYVFRNLVAAKFPAAKPLLIQACAIVDCQVGLPAQIESVSIESSELQALPPAKDSFALTLLLRNRSSTVQMWPNIELTLNDANDKAIGRRVFLPRDYLVAPLDAAKGFASNSEQQIKIPFQLDQLKASGFRVYVFYP